MPVTVSEHPLKYSVHSRLREHHLRRLLPAAAGPRLLDVGCGLGFLLEGLGERFEAAVGLEYDPSSLLVNRSRGLNLMVRGSAWQLPFREGAFDVVLCSEVLEHLPDGMDLVALKELARVTRPGGRILITVPALEGLRARSRLRNLGHDDPSGGEYHYRQGYAWRTFQDLVEQTGGLRVDKRVYSMFFLSELLMDLMKLVYTKKSRLKEHSDVMNADSSLLFRVFRLVFPLLFGVFLLEDWLFCPSFKGHILLVSLEKQA